MPVAECMRRVSHREFLGWVAWMNNQWNSPSRSDWYLMELMAVVRRLMHDNPASVQPRQFRLRFDDESAESKPGHSVEQSKSTWMTATGYKDD